MKTEGVKIIVPKLLAPLNARKAAPLSLGNTKETTQTLEDSDNDSDIHEIDVSDFILNDTKEEETLSDIRKHLETKAVLSGAQAMVAQAAEQSRMKGVLQKLPEMPEDYVRNFMYHRGLFKALEAFQDEWYEFKLMGKLRPDDTLEVPNVYKQTEKMSEMLNSMREQVHRHEQTVSEVKRNFEQLTRERDYHRMHHKRLQHEKDKLIDEVKKLKKEMTAFEPLLKQAQVKYDALVKEKSLVALERDRLSARVKALESMNRKSTDSIKGKSAPNTPGSTKQANEKPENTSSSSASGAIKIKPNSSGSASSAKDKQERSTPKSERRVNPFPEKERTNPFENIKVDSSDPIAIMDNTKQFSSLKSHSGTVTSVVIHPEGGQYYATTSSDKTWRLWSSDGDLCFTGEGHKNILTGCDFHPSGRFISTCSGDNTIKIWSIETGNTVTTLKEHIQPVWSCQYHDLGQILLSTSMDHTIKLWDIEKGKPRQTIRHHGDSVKRGTWKPYSNVFLTCSADKRVAVWDARNGVCLHTFSQTSSINHVSVSKQGNLFATCNAAGQVVIYDLRKMASLKEMTIYGPAKKAKANNSLHPKISLNTVEFHSNSDLVAVGGNDGLFRLLQWNTETPRSLTVPWLPADLSIHDASLLPMVEETGMNITSILFNPFNNQFMSSGSDGYVRMYQ